MPEIYYFKVSQFVRGISQETWSSTSLTSTIFKDAVVASVPGFGVTTELVEITSITNSERLIPVLIQNTANAAIKIYFQSKRQLQSQSMIKVSGVTVNYTISYFEMDKQGTTFWYISNALKAATSGGVNSIFDKYLQHFSVQV
jgi:hypothetical protein